MVKKLYICIVKRATTILHQLQSITPGVYLVLCALVVLVALGSCTPTKDPDHILERIAQADAIKESNPTQACDIMRSIDRDSIVTEEGLARYALIYSEACYFSRGYVDVDSLSSIALRFYSKTDMHNEHARAQFQQAYVMYNAHKHPETIIALLEAEKLLEHCDNERLLGVVHRSKGDVYHYGGLYQNSYDSYSKAIESFERCGLQYHIYYSKYNLARAATMLHDYDLAERLFFEARDWAIENDDKDFLCVVLHELCEMYILRRNFTKCAEAVEMFERYDCAKWLMSRYYAICAIVELEVNNDLQAAYSMLDLAEQHPQRDEEIIEKTRYLIYKHTGNDTKALKWCEKLLVRSNNYTREIVSQPVLDYQIDLLRTKLSHEEAQKEAIIRERNLSFKLNMAIVISFTIIILFIVILQRIRVRQKDRDIDHYVAMIDKLQLTRNDISQPMADAIDRLYNDRLKELNRLCETFYEHSDTSRQVSKVFEEVRLTIEQIKGDDARIDELERSVNSYHNGLMSKLREQCPKLNDKELKVALYSYAGFSARAISVFVDSNPVALSKIKYRMKTKIKECDGPDADMLIQNLVDR